MNKSDLTALLLPVTNDKSDSCRFVHCVKLAFVCSFAFSPHTHTHLGQCEQIRTINFSFSLFSKNHAICFILSVFIVISPTPSMLINNASCLTFQRFHKILNRPRGPLSWWLLLSAFEWRRNEEIMVGISLEVNFLTSRLILHIKIRVLQLRW